MDDVADDNELMILVGQGDAAAFRALVERHAGRAVATAERMTGTRADAEDIAQEAFLRVWRSAAAWEPRARFTTWLYRVVVNLCIDRRRRPRLVDLDSVPELPDPARDAEADAAAVEVGRAVGAALLELPDRQRVALVLCHYEGCSMAEAAEILETTVGAIESLLVRGRAALRDRLIDVARDHLGLAPGRSR